MIKKKRFIVFFLLLTTLSHFTYAEQYKDCGLNKKSRALARLIINDPKQNRITLTCNLKLSEIAYKKAKEMASLGRVTHLGRSPANKRLFDEGYPLAKIYPRFLENNVEAVAGGVKDTDTVWQKFKKSEAHRTHLLAEHEFYLLQNEIGVGYYFDLKTPHIDYWAVYIAHHSNKKVYQGKIAKSKQ
jgi:uncharacterized protein YkwD